MFIYMKIYYVEVDSIEKNESYLCGNESLFEVYLNVYSIFYIIYWDIVVYSKLYMFN